MITQNKLKEILVYDQNNGVFSYLNGRKAGSLDKKRGYALLSINSKTYLAHRIAWLYMFGEFPINEIDHINGIRSDNRLCNLRDIPKNGNMQNKCNPSSSNKTGYLGVSLSKDKKKFCATIRKDGKTFNLGTFNTAIDAHNVYLAAKKDLHEFSRRL